MSVPEDLSSPLMVTVGHLCENKGTSLALETAKKLKEKGLEFKWYFIGADTGEKDYKKMVLDYGLQKYIFFPGLRSNPYPYIAAATIIVHPSKYEGKSIALDEAKILAKPVVVTNFSTVNDQFTDRYNASICKMDVDDLCKNIIELLENHLLANCYIENLKKDLRDNSSEVQKIYSLLK